MGKIGRNIEVNLTITVLDLITNIFNLKKKSWNY